MVVGILCANERFYFVLCRQPMPETKPTFGGETMGGTKDDVFRWHICNFELHRAFLTEFYIHLISPVSVTLTLSGV